MGTFGGFSFNIVCPSPRLWEAWDAKAGVGRLWCVLRGWKAWEGFGRLRQVLGCFGRLWEALAASVRLCKLWMLWRLQRSLAGMEGFDSVFGSFERLWEALMETWYVPCRVRRSIMSGRPLVLDRILNLRAGRIFCMLFHMAFRT